MTSMIAACAAGPIVEFGGRFLRVYPRTLRHISEIKAQIMHAWGDPMLRVRQLVDSAPEESRKATALACLRTVRHRWADVSADDMNRFLLSPEGRILTVYHAFEKNGVSYEWIFDKCCEAFDTQGDEWYYDLLWRFRMASGDLEVFDLCSIRNIREYNVDEEFDRYGGDQGLIASLAREPFCFHPDQVKELTFAQVRSICAGRDGADDDDRMTERTEIVHPIDKTHKKVVAAQWNRRYDALVDNLVSGKPLLEGLRN